MKKYVGITIGPIGDTLSEASTPAALWFASSLFSDLTKRLCEAITKVFLDVSILSPYYAEDVATGDGVGKFHDRIIFSTEQYDGEKLKKLVEEAKENTYQNFPKRILVEQHKEFLKQYLQVHYVVLSQEEIGKQNAILAISPYLDLMELMKTFPTDSKFNPIKKLFLGEVDSSNYRIKESPLFLNIKAEHNQLKRDKDGIWTIEEIAKSHIQNVPNMKKYSYFAVVSADGDGMGKFLEQLDDEKVTEFSHTCLKYDEEAAKLIGNYGGMTIYAGGDDLLFLAPVENMQGQNIWWLCNEIQKKFTETIRNAKELKEITQTPTVSFGISIQYVKYPLYEALKNASTLLWKAKNDGKTKNKMAFTIQKHSGQSTSFIVSNQEYDVLQKILSGQFENQVSQEETLHSIIYTLSAFQPIFCKLDDLAKKKQIDKEAYKKAWMNFFDNVGQVVAKNYIEEICSIYFDEFLSRNIEMRMFLEEERKYCTENVTQSEQEQILSKLLWIKKFLNEKGDVKR